MPLARAGRHPAGRRACHPLLRQAYAGSMAGMEAYERDYVDACRARAESQVAMFREVQQSARRLRGDDSADLESSLDSLEPEYFNNMLLVLELCFVHRRRGVGGEEDSPLNEVRALANSLMQNGGAVMADRQNALDAERSVLGLREGDSIRLTMQQYTRLANAFFRAIEQMFTTTND